MVFIQQNINPGKERTADTSNTTTESQNKSSKRNQLQKITYSMTIYVEI